MSSCAKLLNTLQVNINGEHWTAELGVFSRLWHHLHPTFSLQSLVLSPGIFLRHYRSVDKPSLVWQDDAIHADDEPRDGPPLLRCP